MKSKSNSSNKNGLSDYDRLSNVLFYLNRIKVILDTKKNFQAFDNEVFKEAITYNLYRISNEIRKMKNINTFKIKKVPIALFGMIIPEIVACDELKDIFDSFIEDSGPTWLKQYIECIYIVLNPITKETKNKSIIEIDCLRKNNSVWTVKKK